MQIAASVLLGNYVTQLVDIYCVIFVAPCFYQFSLPNYTFLSPSFERGMKDD